MSSAQFGAEPIQLRFHLNLAQSEYSLDNASDTASAAWDKRSIEDPGRSRPKIDSGMDELYDINIFWLSLKSSGSAWCISASDS